ncbi:hypothetical protein BRD11_03530 [Halobacteriales archaeon SW_12_69_24]|nr:MAG: hypothetical protein BRD11_03530 [Halobacteriales archaeon SW_12_69_24]
MVDAVPDRSAVLARLDACRFMLDELVSFVILRGGVNLYFGNWVPAALSAAYGYALRRTDRFDFPER